ncbi:hypothetical protein CR155_04860 [Pollutimonas nitritireducens]|uniref:Lipoprotein n=1 Tax=Pollutimonas nitritireducens TaxID=2045209 RepID=A0A2N4UIE9_9BURK|nr:hypothetical protein [Pollutimonas nitritireducens]PLC54802.1 hypothetical protein CR155_04860 [Pollutimonas nitritireducens]
MYDLLLRPRPLMAGLATAVFLAGCAAPVTAPPTPPTKTVPKCVAAAMGEPLIGNWLSVRKQKGVAGELRTLITLNADGTMAYTEQLKRGKNPSQGLEEAGCWRRDKKMLVLQTLESNGAPVNLDDPIYTNRYTVVSSSATALTVKSQDATRITARRMSPGYRLPF